MSVQKGSAKELLAVVFAVISCLFLGFGITKLYDNIVLGVILIITGIIGFVASIVFAIIAKRMKERQNQITYVSEFDYDEYPESVTCAYCGSKYDITEKECPGCGSKKIIEKQVDD